MLNKWISLNNEKLKKNNEAKRLFVLD